MQKTTIAVTLALLMGAGSASVQAHDHEVLRGRLIFSDYQKPTLSVLDLDTFKVTHTFDVGRANAALVPTEDGRFTIVNLYDDAGTIAFLDTGLTYESHDDHLDVHKGEPRLLPLRVTGDKPSHITSENGWVAWSYDGLRPWDGPSKPESVMIRLSDLDSANPVVEKRKSPAPQHGITAPLGNNQWLISVPKAAYAKGDDKTVTSRPNGFVVYQQDKDWKAIADFNQEQDLQRSCKEFHGHSALNHVHVFGCNAKLLDGDAKSDGGVLIVKQQSGKWVSHKLAYPDDRRTSTLKSGLQGTYVIGNYGGLGGQPFNALIRIDPQAKKLTAQDTFAIPDAQAVCKFEVSADGKRVANLTPDGKLRLYDVAPNWKQVASFDAVEAFDCAYGAKTPTPSLAIVGGSVYVSDPVNQRIREFYLNSAKQGLDIKIDGAPTELAGKR
ncbi:hypothetical protein WCT65_04295 [Pectobacterium carotovorum]|uniref:hypothetical protein n=1 Tax=Pectobacterium carotovorum TaxID=554 RepID=UPI003019304B